MRRMIRSQHAQHGFRPLGAPGARSVLARTAAYCTLALTLTVPATAGAQDADALARQTQNPVSSLISVPIQGNWDFGLGDADATGSLFNIQPVIPFAVTPDTNMILRVIVPLASLPGSDGARINGVGDILATAFLSPAEAGRLIWGAGPVLLLPTATTNALGSEKFGLGPSAVALVQPGKWTLGGLFNHIWSLSGTPARGDVNKTLLQPFASYNLGNGLSVSLTLEASANWEAAETWTVPLLVSVSKVTLLGSRPVSFQVGAGPTVVRPAAASSWRFRASMTFLFPR